MGAVNRRLPQTSNGDSQTTRAAVARAKDGDREALHFLYIRYSADVLRQIEGLVQDRHEAEAITRDIFLKLMTAIQKYERQEAPFAAWILEVARDAALDHLQARRTAVG